MILTKLTPRIIFFFFFPLLFIFCNTNNRNNNTPIDSSSKENIDSFLEQSENTDDFLKKKSNILKAYNYCSALKNDSLRSKYLSTIIDQSLDIKDYTLFKKVNKERFLLSNDLKDSLSIGECYWRYGNYYLISEDLDSAYYSYNQANKIFNRLNNDYYSAKMIYGLAAIKKELRDFTGSEILVFQAIKKLKPLNKNTSLYLCYHLLGVNFQGLQEYNRALYYHKEALKYLKKVKVKNYYNEISLNNIGLIHREIKNYELAIKSFKEALENDELKKKDKTLYAVLIDNLAYTKLKNNDTVKIEQSLNEALKLRDSLKNVSGIVISKLHLAEFFIFKRDTLKAKSYAKDTYELAKSVNNHRDRLAALKLLAKLDKKNASTYLEEHITLNDSLQTQERAIRNKFTRIQFETDEYVEETKRLSLQNLLISTIGGSLLLVFVLLYFIKRQRAKNKELLFESEQQKINQEVYALMLKQQVKLEEGRLQERHRISEELHDGVLGKLFGTRIGLGYLALEDHNNQKEFKSYINEIQQVENDIRDISHELKQDILISKADFASIIEDYVMTQCKLNKLQYHFSCDSKISWNTIKDSIKVTMYRIVQEALQNIVKHAKANSIAINFNFNPETLHLVITDNGVGFNVKNRKKGIGLKNMASRLDKINGQITIVSDHGKGTILDITIPL